MVDVAVLDIDGTLVDSTYHHALAWSRAFRAHGIVLEVWRIHRHIGMGGDRLVAAVAGDEVERSSGDDLRSAWEAAFEPLLDEIEPFRDANALLRELKRRGHRVVLASSGKAAHVERFVDLLDARELVDAWTTADDVEVSKPAPDLLEVALKRVGGGGAATVGDAPWDCQAAEALGIPCVAVRTGGFGVEELTEAGAAAVFDSLGELLERLDQTPLGRP
jgi:phosphoglycolate phosphatase-like HAD superfamily hydrolase